MRLLSTTAVIAAAAATGIMAHPLMMPHHHAAAAAAANDDEASSNSAHAHTHRASSSVAPFGPNLHSHRKTLMMPDTPPPPPSSQFGSASPLLAAGTRPLDAAVALAKNFALKQLQSQLRPSVAASSAEVFDVVVTDSHISQHTGVVHVYLVQTIDGLEVVNGVAAVHVGPDGDILSFSSSFFDGASRSVSDESSSTTASDNAAGTDSTPFVFQDGASIFRRDRTDGSWKKGDSDGKHRKKDKGRKSSKKEKHRKPSKHHDDDDDDDDDDDYDDDHDHHHGKDGKKENSNKKANKASSKSTETVATTSNSNAFISPKDAVLAFSNKVGIELDSSRIDVTPFQSLRGPSRTDPDFHIAGVTPPNSPNPIVPAKLKYILLDDGSLVAVWDLQVDLNDKFYHAHIHAVTGELLSLVDWVSDASYTVLPLGINDPEVGDRQIVVDPAHIVASPNGWHWQLNDTTKEVIVHTSTKGNNVFAQENPNGKGEWINNYRPDGGGDLKFDFPVNFTADPKEYVDAAIANLFYWNNAIHDLFYVYGFTETAGNFQQDNLGRGGKGGDAVIANAQDGSGLNNANFATPPDGTSGRMRMYVWDVSDPMRDGDLDGGIIMHEYAHGISIRLTGGPANSGCLGWGESGGMGEGWGDFFATILRTTPNSTREDIYGMAEYCNGGKGIRKYRYSTSFDVNPSTYSYVSKPAYWGVHAKGEVWAEILYEVYWNLVDEHGFNEDWFDSPFGRAHNDESTFRDFRSGKVMPRSSSKPLSRSSSSSWDFGGNVLALQLVVDGLKLQPCNPTFVDARNAILLADKALTGGKNVCLMWKAFAKRGLGEAAAAGGKEDFSVPKKCREDGGDDDENGNDEVEGL